MENFLRIFKIFAKLDLPLWPVLHNIYDNYAITVVSLFFFFFVFVFCFLVFPFLSLFVAFSLACD